MQVLCQARSGIRTRDPSLTMAVLWPAELSGRSRHCSGVCLIRSGRFDRLGDRRPDGAAADRQA